MKTETKVFVCADDVRTIKQVEQFAEFHNQLYQADLSIGCTLTNGGLFNANAPNMPTLGVLAEIKDIAKSYGISFVLNYKITQHNKLSTLVYIEEQLEMVHTYINPDAICLSYIPNLTLPECFNGRYLIDIRDQVLDFSYIGSIIDQVHCFVVSYEMFSTNNQFTSLPLCISDMPFSFVKNLAPFSSKSKAIKGFKTGDLFTYDFSSSQVKKSKMYAQRIQARFNCSHYD